MKKFKKFKGTKGEWFLESKKPLKGNYPSKEFSIHFSPYNQYCISIFSSQDAGIKEDLANARLVTAAPNLLEAGMEAFRLLEEMNVIYGFDVDGHEKISSTMSTLKKALKKALK